MAVYRGNPAGPLPNGAGLTGRKMLFDQPIRENIL